MMTYEAIETTDVASTSITSDTCEESPRVALAIVESTPRKYTLNI